MSYDEFYLIEYEILALLLTDSVVVERDVPLGNTGDTVKLFLFSAADDDEPAPFEAVITDCVCRLSLQPFPVWLHTLRAVRS